MSIIFKCILQFKKMVILIIALKLLHRLMYIIIHATCYIHVKNSCHGCFWSMVIVPSEGVMYILPRGLRKYMTPEVGTIAYSQSNHGAAV